MKILFVVEHFYPYIGGAEELFLNLASSLVQSGNKVSVVTTLHDETLKSFEVYQGIEITRVKCHNRFLFTILSLPKVIRQAKEADFIHTTSYNSAIPSFIAGLLTKKKVLITFHEVWDKLWFRLPFTPKLKLACFYLYEQLILKLRFDKYFAVSEYTKRCLLEQGIPENKIVRIYNGVNYGYLQSFKFQPPEKFTVCFFGRLGISKGIDILLEATKIFTSRQPDFLLKLIIPTYPENLYRKITKLIDKYKIGNHIKLMHNLDKDVLLSEISTSSCVVIPSLSEGFCFVAVESVAIGIPIITSRNGSLPEVTGGNLITLDSVTAEEISSSFEKAKSGKWDYENPPLFNFEQCIENYILCYSEIMNKRN